jgi:hypothetical protein
MNEETKLFAYAICKKCENLRPLDQFNIANKKTGRRRGECRDCANAVKREWQKKNGKEAYKRYKAGSTSWKWQHMKLVRDTVNEMKKAPCADCGGTFNPWVMDFDHLDGDTKSGNIATMIRAAKPLDAILREISKCELVCSNCHRDRTYKRQERRWYEPPSTDRNPST